MRISFVLPFPPRIPGGGTKVMYQYANLLAEMGHHVEFYHANKTQYLKYRTPSWLRYFYIKYFEPRVPKWFPLAKAIKSHVIPYVSDKFIDDADAIVSTWWATAMEVDKLSKSKGAKFNLIQDYEIWTGHVDKVHASYCLQTVKIVYVKYLISLIEKYGGNTPFYIPIGIDRGRFSLTSSIDERTPFSICMMYSEEPRKGSYCGLQALLKLKSRYPQLEVRLFSVFSRPPDLPNWIQFFERPDDLCSIYNNSAIYMTPALQEGWALPPAEAMVCGCAVVCTDIPGHYDYGINNETVLLTEKNNLDDIVTKIAWLINDNIMRIRIAKNGNLFAQRYEWKLAGEQFEKVLTDHI